MPRRPAGQAPILQLAALLAFERGDHETAARVDHPTSGAARRPVDDRVARLAGLRGCGVVSVTRLSINGRGQGAHLAAAFPYLLRFRLPSWHKRTEGHGQNDGQKRFESPLGGLCGSAHVESSPGSRFHIMGILALCERTASFKTGKAFPAPARPVHPHHMPKVITCSQLTM